MSTEIQIDTDPSSTFGVLTLINDFNSQFLFRKNVDLKGFINYIYNTNQHQRIRLIEIFNYDMLYQKQEHPDIDPEELSEMTKHAIFAIIYIPNYLPYLKQYEHAIIKDKLKPIWQNYTNYKKLYDEYIRYYNYSENIDEILISLLFETDDFKKLYKSKAIKVALELFKRGIRDPRSETGNHLLLCPVLKLLFKMYYTIGDSKLKSIIVPMIDSGILDTTDTQNINTINICSFFDEVPDICKTLRAYTLSNFMSLNILKTNLELLYQASFYKKEYVKSFNSYNKIGAFITTNKESFKTLINEKFNIILNPSAVQINNRHLVGNTKMFFNRMINLFLFTDPKKIDESFAKLMIYFVIDVNPKEFINFII